jgi:N-methylhydantoinase A/oxoprolinase/acetone carboxylase beta subunit
MDKFRVGVDIGGTFTDIVFLAPDGRRHTKKGIVREKSITLPKRQNRVSSPLISLDFSGSIRAVRRLPQVSRILL